MDPSFVMPPAKRKYEWDSEEPNARKKRRASASSRGPPPPLKIGPDETVFRILCVGSKTGGIVGKGGSIIKQIRRETGAKIRIEEGVLGCEERVIVIVAPEKDIDRQTEQTADERSAAKGQDGTVAEEKGGGSEEDLEKEKHISPAQEALLRVHDRIVEGEPDVKVDEETDKKTTTTVTRLLVPINQVGCVLGKGGKIIQQIRIESGSQIRVLSRQQVPACALPTDEVVQIMGDVTAVKKALLAVSHLLRENPRRHRENFHTTRPVGHLSQGSGIPRGGLISRKNSSLTQGARFPGVMPFGGIDYHSKGPSSVSMTHETGSNMRQIVHPQEEITFRLLCSNDKVGGIIGKAGTIVQGLQRDTGADIKIANSVPEEDERVVIITASAVPEGRLSPAQNALLRVYNRVVTSGPEKDKFATARLLVPSTQIGCLLGKGGIIIAEMRKLTGSNILIFRKDQLPKCASQNDQVVQVTGEQGAVQEALVWISTRLQNNLFPEEPVSVAGVGIFPEAGVGIYPEHMPPLPGPMAPFRGRPEPGLSPGMYPHYRGPLQDIYQGERLSHNVDRPGFAPNVHRPIGMNRNIDQPPPPGPWAVQGMGDGSAQSMTDYGRGYPQRGSLGSGSQSAVVRNRTVEVVVPERVIGSIYGENGSNLAHIQQISGAKVIMNDSRPGATEGLVIISGTPEQTLAAQSLVQAFIMSGESSP